MLLINNSVYIDKQEWHKQCKPEQWRYALTHWYQSPLALLHLHNKVTVQRKKCEHMNISWSITRHLSSHQCDTSKFCIHQCLHILFILSITLTIMQGIRFKISLWWRFVFLNPVVCVLWSWLKHGVTWLWSEASPPSPQQGLCATGTPADRQHAFTSKKGLPFKAMKTMKRGHYNGDTEGYLIHLCSSQVLIIAGIS